MIELILPWPPSINHYWRHCRGRHFISTEGKRYRTAVNGLCRDLTPLEGDLSLELVAYPPDRRRRDLDNLFKSLLDALQHGGAYHDDSQIKALNAKMQAPHKGGLIEIKIEPLKICVVE